MLATTAQERPESTLAKSPRSAAHRTTMARESRRQTVTPEGQGKQSPDDPPMRTEAPAAPPPSSPSYADGVGLRPPLPPPRPPAYEPVPVVRRRVPPPLAEPPAGGLGPHLPSRTPNPGRPSVPSRGGRSALGRPNQFDRFVTGQRLIIRYGPLFPAEHSHWPAMLVHRGKRPSLSKPAI